MSYRADESRWELNTSAGVQAAVLDYKREYDEKVRDSIPVDSTVHSCINAMVTYTAPGVSDRDKRSALTEIRNLELLHPGRMERLLNAFKILCTPPFSPRANHGGEDNYDGYEQIGPDPLAENHEDEPEPIFHAAAAAPVGFFPRHAEFKKEEFRREIVSYQQEYAAWVPNAADSRNINDIERIRDDINFLIKLSSDDYSPTEDDCVRLNVIKTTVSGRLQIFAEECSKLFKIGDNLYNEPKTEPKGELPK